MRALAVWVLPCPDTERVLSCMHACLFVCVCVCVCVVLVLRCCFIHKRMKLKEELLLNLMINEQAQSFTGI